MRLGAFEEHGFELGELLLAQQRFAASAVGFAQARCAVLAILAPPFANRLSRHAQPSRRLGLVEPLLDHPDGIEAALLQRLEIPPRAFPCTHT